MLTNWSSIFSLFLSHDHVILHLHFTTMTILLDCQPHSISAAYTLPIVIYLKLTGLCIVLPSTFRYIIKDRVYRSGFSLALILLDSAAAAQNLQMFSHQAPVHLQIFKVVQHLHLYWLLGINKYNCCWFQATGPSNHHGQKSKPYSHS